MVKSVFAKKNQLKWLNINRGRSQHAGVCEAGSSTLALPQVEPDPVFPRAQSCSGN